jgi:hypothetical protein
LRETPYSVPVCAGTAVAVGPGNAAKRLIDKEICRQGKAGSRFRKFTARIHDIGKLWGFETPARKQHNLRRCVWAEGNSPQFDEKAGIFRGCGRQRNEAIGVIMAMITAMPYDGIDKRGEWAPRTGNEILLYGLH